MFYRAWDAAQKRPTRSLWIAAMTLVIGGIAHFKITDWVLHAAIGSPETVEEQFVAIGILARSLPWINAAAIGDAVSVISGLILGTWAAWRTFRRRP